METYTDGSQAKKPLYFNYEYSQERTCEKHQQDGRQTKTDAKLPASARPGWSARTPTQSTPFT